jgi:hypothetical protein
MMVKRITTMDQFDKKRSRNEIVGSIALQEIEANPSGSFAAALRELLDKLLEDPAERSQFALPAIDARGGGDSVGHG